MANRVQHCRRVSHRTYVLDHVLRLYSLGHNLGLNTNHNRISSPQLPMANERTEEWTCLGPKNVPLTNSIHRRQSGRLPRKGPPRRGTRIYWRRRCGGIFTGALQNGQKYISMRLVPGRRRRVNPFWQGYIFVIWPLLFFRYPPLLAVFIGPVERHDIP